MPSRHPRWPIRGLAATCAVVALATGRIDTGDGRYAFLEANSQTPAAAPLRNELASATSPYLRSAANQPVAWQPWGPEAFALAARLRRPIWLDIGAVWCHWCHVMDRESYSDPEIAALINRYYVPIKVDRDERPDIDARYQAAHLALNGRMAGWPLTMFLTVTGEPFLGGGYYPPDTRNDRSGVRTMAPRIAKLYLEHPEQAIMLGREARKQVAESRMGPAAKGTLTVDVVKAIAKGVDAAFDTKFGGFGASEGPKFPEAESLRLSLAQSFLTDNDGLKRKALRTLDAYATSGMRDHVNGGFFRYSSDRAMTIPHFEKMDYVQSGLIEAYLDAFRLTGDSGYSDVARDIVRYVDRRLADRTHGGFYAHQDADTNLDDDGSFYTWSLVQAQAVLTADELTVLAPYYGLRKKGGITSHPNQNVLRVGSTVPEVAKKLALSENEVRERARRGTRKLEAARRDQRAPFIEETKFTDRNAMMISAYLHYYEALQDIEVRDFALKTVDFLLTRAVTADGHVYHATAEGRSYVPGLMLDYAMLSDALLDAYLVTARSKYLAAAERLMNRAVDVFGDAQHGGFFDRPVDAQALALLTDRTKPFVDTVLPGDNAVAGRVLGKLYMITSEERWRALAEKTLTAFAGARPQSTLAATYASAVEAHLRHPPQAVILGPQDDRRTADLANAARRTFRPGRQVVVFDPDSVSPESLPAPIAQAARIFARDRTPRAYVCVGESCAPPTIDAGALAALVRHYGRTTSR